MYWERESIYYIYYIPSFLANCYLYQINWYKTIWYKKRRKVCTFVKMTNVTSVHGNRYMVVFWKLLGCSRKLMSLL